MLRDEDNREAIADLFSNRFRERYIEPFKENSAKHGFSILAAGCLMLEALYCFRRGEKKTGEKGGIAFENFFVESSELHAFIGHGGQFYKNVRCGILHQGETYGGWRIRRVGPLLDSSRKVVNATKYLNALEIELQKLVADLSTTPFNGPLWRNVIRKLDSICEICNALHHVEHGRFASCPNLRLAQNQSSCKAPVNRALGVSEQCRKNDRSLTSCQLQKASDSLSWFR